MGFIGNFLKTIFNPKIPTVASQQVQTTGRDILPSTEDEEPEAPVMGSDKKKNRRRGIDSLLVPSENLYKGNGGK